MVPVDAIREVSAEEAVREFDERAQAFLGMSGAEFLAAWDGGAFIGDDRPQVAEVAILLPLGRQHTD